MDTSGRRRGRRRAAVISAAMIVVAMFVPAASSPAQQATVPSATKDPQRELTRLKHRADQLAKDYRGRIETLTDAQRAAKKTVGRSGRLDRRLRAARVRVRRLAASSYMNGGPIGDGATMRLMFGPQGTDTGDMATVEHFARDNGERVRNLRRLSARAGPARRAAQRKLGRVRRQVTDLEKQRTRVRNLLARYKPEKPSKPSPPPKPSRPSRSDPPRTPDRIRHGKSPIVGDYTTSRMRKVRDEIDAKFGPFPTIGCYRAGDPQDHGSGRACDFMESTAGRMPSSTAQAHGDRVAQYAIDNASRLGVKYVIWKQRIHDVRSSGGWERMEDRGSITQNHDDHVHISVF